MTAPAPHGETGERARAAAMWSALENVGAFDHSNDASRDRAYVAAILRDSLDAAEARGRAEAAAKIEELAEPGEPDARMAAYYYGFERTGVGIVDAILSAVATAGKAYHGTDMWAEEDEWTKPSHEARIQAAADAAAARLRAAAAELSAPGGAE